MLSLPGDVASNLAFHIPSIEFDTVDVVTDANQTTYSYRKDGALVYEHVDGLYGPVFSDYVGAAKVFRNQEPVEQTYEVVDDVDDEDERELAQEFSDFLTRTPGMKPAERAKALVDIMKNLDWEPGSESERLRVKVRDTERERDEALRASYEEAEIEPVFDDLPVADPPSDKPDDDYYDVVSSWGTTVRRYKTDKNGNRMEIAIKDLEDRTAKLDEQIKQGVMDAETVRDKLSKWIKK